MTARAKQLFDTSVDQVRRGQVRAALVSLLDALALEPLHRESLEAAARICRVLGSPEDARRFGVLADGVPDGERLYDLGFHLVDQGRPDVGAAILQAALERGPDGAFRDRVRRELAFARFQMGEFGACLTTLSPLLDEGDRSETERLDLELLAAESALYAGRARLCQEFLRAADERVADDGQRLRLDALFALAARASRWDGRLPSLGLREWHHIQHAGVILKTAGGWFEDGSLAGRFDVLDLRLDMLAFLLQRLLDLLERWELLPDAVAPGSTLARPLAEAVARRLAVPVLEGPEDEAAPADGRTLLLAVAASELTPHAALLSSHGTELQVASLALDWSSDGPLCPEITGVLARRVFMPWEERLATDPLGGPGRPSGGDDRPADEIGADLVAAMKALPDDGGRAREEFLSFYLPLADELVLGRPGIHPVRRQFTRLSPARQPTGSRPAGARALSD